MKTLEAANVARIKRYYLVSAFPEAWRECNTDESFENYMRVKKRADVALSQSSLDWVILRPSELRSNAGTGRIDIGYAQFHTLIERDDVATILAELIHTPEIRRVIREVSGGDTAIPAAIEGPKSDFSAAEK